MIGRPGRSLVARLMGPSGYAMAALLVGLAVMSVLLAMAMPVWRTLMTREREDELIFRGRQYARAVGLYQRKYANAYPPSLDVLLQQRFLRRKYKDPMVADGEFQLLYQSGLPQAPGAGRGGPAGQIDSARTQGGRGGAAAGTTSGPGGSQLGGSIGLGGGQSPGPGGGIVGVASKSTATSLRVYEGRTVYNQWQFINVPTTPAGGTPQGGQRPRGPGAGQPGAGSTGGPGRPAGARPGGGGRPPG